MAFKADFNLNVKLLFTKIEHRTSAQVLFYVYLVFIQANLYYH